MHIEIDRCLVLVPLQYTIKHSDAFAECGGTMLWYSFLVTVADPTASPTGRPEQSSEGDDDIAIKSGQYFGPRRHALTRAALAGVSARGSPYDIRCLSSCTQCTQTHTYARARACACVQVCMVGCL